MNKARPTMSGSLIKHRTYLKYIKYNTNNNNNNNNNNNSNISSSSSCCCTNNNEEEEKEINENFEMKD
jgi:hypothetical protein